MTEDIEFFQVDVPTYKYYTELTLFEAKLLARIRRLEAFLDYLPAEEADRTTCPKCGAQKPRKKGEWRVKLCEECLKTDSRR